MRDSEYVRHGKQGMGWNRRCHECMTDVKNLQIKFIRRPYPFLLAFVLDSIRYVQLISSLRGANNRSLLQLHSLQKRAILT